MPGAFYQLINQTAIMKNTYLKFLFFIITAISILSCNEKKKITGLQGKVKYETIGLAPKIPGRISKIKVGEGQLVHKGDTLIILDAPEINAKIQQSEGAVESAAAQYDLAKNGATPEQVEQIASQVQVAKDQLAFAEKTYQRMRNMFDDSLITAQQFDEVQMKFQSAKSQLNALNAKQVEVVKGTRPENVRITAGQVVRANAAKAEAEIASGEKYIIAPADMLIETISLTLGELALPGYTLVNGYKTNSLYFRFTVAESIVNQFKIGQLVEIEVPYTKKGFPATITAIKQLPRYADNTSASPDYQLGETVYELKIIAGSYINEGLYQNSTVLLKMDTVKKEK
jgi:HlyD family secretion protein